MSPITLVKRISSYRSFLRIILFAGIAALTGWATFTSYSAKLDKANEQSNQSPEASRVSPKRAHDDSRATLNKNYGKLPLSFEVNRGQTDASVKYVARGPGYNIFLTPTEAVLVFQNTINSNESATEAGETDEASVEPASHLRQRERLLEVDKQRSATAAKQAVVKMRLEGANVIARAIEGVDELPGKVNYFLGNESSKWLTGLPTYSKVSYSNVYPGIDLVYYGNQQQLEYDLVVAPGADPSLIQIKFDGAENLRTDKQGNLILKTAAGELRQGKPSIFQKVNGTKKQVDGSYVLKQGNKIGFKVSRYDRHQPLVIDPILSYLSFVNTRGRGFAIAVDPSGFAYITGSLDAGDDLPATPGAYQIAGGGGQDVFVTKLNQAGSGVLYSTYIGGPGDDDAYAIALDPGGSAYITGYATPGFPTTPGSFKPTLAVGFDAFVAKLNPTGSGLVYSTFFGGLNYEECDGIVVDGSGNAYVAGLTESIDLPTTAGAVQTTNRGSSNAFVAQFNATGSSLLYATYLGGGGRDFGLNVALDGANNIYAVGLTTSLNFPTVGTLQPPSGTDRGLFKSTSSGGSWSLSRNGLTTGTINALAVNPNSPSTIYAGTNGGVSKSTDGGATWAATGTLPGGFVQTLAIDPTNSNVVYAGTLYGVFKTTNGGGIWVAMNNGLTFPATSGAPLPASVRGLAIDRNTPATVYAAANGGMFKTTDGGANWTLINNGITTLGMRAVVIDPSNSATVYAVSNTRVYKSTNGGASWSPIITGLPSVNTYRTLAIDPVTPTTLYVGGGVGVYKTTNGGTNWSAVVNNLLVPYTDNVSRLAFVVALVVDPNTPTTLYAGAANGFVATGGYPLACVLKSTDGGANWTAITTGFNGVQASALSLAIDPTNPANVYLGSSGDFEAFVTKITPGNPTPLFSTYLGGSRTDVANGVKLDSSGNVYITGRTGSPNFPATGGAFQTTLAGATDAFVAKLSATNNAMVFATYLGGSSTEDGHGLALDAAGNIYVAGRTASSNFPTTPGSFQTKIGNPSDLTKGDVFVTKLDASGSTLGYSSYLGGAGDEAVSPFGLQLFNTLGLDALGNAYVVGITSDPSTFPAFDYVNVNNAFGANATFVAKISNSSASFSITGRLTTATNTPIAGASVGASNAQGIFSSGVSDSQGFYSIISLPAGDYTVTPEKYDGSGRHYLYAPPTRTFTGLNSDQTANFTGTQVFDIQGQVTSSTVPGLGIFDVTVTLSGSASATTITDASGNYSFRDLLPGNYTVTPTKGGFTFNPANLSFINLSADQFSANFTTASAPLFTVSGRVADASNTGISNVVISMLLLPLRGSRVVTTLSDANGNYSFPNLQAGGNYTFTAAKPVLSFSPQSPTLSNLSGNQTLNFTASQPTGLIGKLAFAKNSADINLINADGTGEQNLVSGGTQCSGGDGMSWSPDGAKLAFSQCAGNQNEDLYIVKADGTGLQKLTDAPFQDVLPSWSPDGTRLTFSYGECSSAELAIPEVFAIDAAGTNRSKLTNNSVFDAFSDWSPGGSTIAFTRGPHTDCSSSEGDDVYVMDPDGANQKKLTNNIPGGIAPAYSPDGFKIAYLRELFDPVTQVFSRALYVMNSDGTGQTKISPELSSLEDGKPTWSPDGTKLAFAGTLLGVNTPRQIFVINADGTGLAQITNDTMFLSSPAWRHFSISGHVTGIPTDVPVTMALAGTLTRVTQTDKNGDYVFGNLAPGGNYSVSPVSAAFGFNPAKTDVSNLAGNQIANFTVLPQVIPAPTPPLVDNFDGGQRDPAKWNLGTQTQPLGAFDAAVSVVQENGRLVITPRTNAADLHYNGYVAVNSFDFNNGTATVEVAQTATGGADTIFAIGSDLDNFSRFVVRDGAGQPGVFRSSPDRGRDVAQLIFQVKIGGQLTSLSIPYDPVEHRFMRFRHEPPTNSIAFETSRDNVAFIVRKEVVLQKGVSALTAELSAGTSLPTNPGQTVFDNFNLVTNTFQFGVSSSSVGEAAGSAEVFVTRTGSVSSPATVEYLSFDDSAQQKSKYIFTTGSLSFAPGETTKSFKVLVVDNNLVEGNKTLFLQLVDSLGAGLNSPGRTALTIVDNDTTPPTTNPLDNSNAQFFVKEHYYDFLNREPDPPGFAFWTGQITSCGNDQACIEVKRINVSASFFLSIEFQQSGYLVHRFYNSSLDRANGLPRYLEFLRDTQTIGRGVVVGAPGWEAQLESNKVGYADKFVLRPEFKLLYPLTLTPTEYVDALYAHARIIPGAVERQAAIDEFNTPTGARGRALRRVVENQALDAREFNRAFVLAQYFGYLRRNPDDQPDNNLAGFNFWLSKLNQFNGNFINAEMVKAFITSGEYRGRFGP